MRTILLALVLLVAGCAHNPVAEMHKVAVHLTRDDEVSCAGTIVGKHAVLTAEHCLVGAHKLAIDDRTVEVVRVIFDHRDHAIVVVKSTFEDWAFIGDEPG